MTDIKKKILSGIVLAIPELLEEYDIAESSEEWLNKKRNKEETNGEVLSFLIGKTIRGNLSLGILTKKINKRINISPKKAEQLAKDIKKIIGLKEKQQRETKSGETPGRDPYRENL
jgi:hypothetical protein